MRITNNPFTNVNPAPTTSSFKSKAVDVAKKHITAPDGGRMYADLCIYNCTNYNLEEYSNTILFTIL